MKTRASLLWLTCTACLGDVEVPPEPPEVSGVQSPTALATQTLRGTKPRDTGVLLGGAPRVPVDAAETFTLEVELLPGPNVLELSTQRPSGLASVKRTTLQIEYEPLCPAAPALDPPPRVTQASEVQLNGRKPRFTALDLGGTELIPLDDRGDFQATLPLGAVDGSFDFALFARDARGQRSDPARFTVKKDTQPASIRARFPAPGAAGVSRNAQLWIGFNEELSFPSGQPDPAVLVLRGPLGPVAGLTTYLPEARALLFSTQNLPASSTLTVELDAARVVDLGGNAASSGTGGPWSYDFVTGAQVDPSPPAAPTLEALPPSTGERQVELRGTKPAAAGLEVNGRLVAVPDGQTRFTYALPLPVGTSSVVVAAVSAAGVRTALAPLSIERQEVLPPAPTVSGAPARVSEPRLALSGGKAAGTSVLIGGRALVCRGPETTWSAAVELVPGSNSLRLEAEDEAGRRSPPLVLEVLYERRFAGLVPDGFTLQVELSLRDLSRAPGIREEFVTGANNYGLDVWLEGPLGPEERCLLTQGHRRDIRYVATLEHYVGNKEQHTIPFRDEDYRGTDYLAALISGGVFTFRGLTADSPRRDASGRELPGLLAGLSEADIRDHFDCLGQVGVDVCTHATTRAGPRRLPPWTPRRRGGRGLLEQGEYLLFVLINLDRDAGWLIGNDLETCWGELEQDRRGMHRVVKKVALGADPFTLTVPPEEELSGPDRASADRLLYLDDPGVVIRWGPG